MNTVVKGEGFEETMARTLQSKEKAFHAAQNMRKK